LLQQSKRKTNGHIDTENAPRRPTLLKEATDPFQCIVRELDLVERKLRESIRSNEPILTEISSHLIFGGGKRIRPIVTLLAFKIFGGKETEAIVEIATALELIHTATLLHDDIIDDAEIRRGKESAYKRFGLKGTLVTGDFLFIKAFEYAGKFDETVVQWTADACTHLTEGEMLQGFFNRNPAVTFEDYIRIVERKTASLFQTGARIGAYLSGADARMIDAMGDCGLNLGISFQMIDDVLDVVGHAELLGKPIGMDLRDGNPSLPIILALNENLAPVHQVFQSNQPNEESVRKALIAMRNGATVNQARKYSKIYAEKAFKPLPHLPASIYRNALKSLVRLIVERDF